MGYAEVGPVAGPTAILLHGWPYGIRSYEGVAPMLTAQGFRVIVPICAVTASRASSRPTAVALDVVGPMDVLGIRSAVLGGFGWGAQTAHTIAVLWPKRSRALVSAAGHPAARRRSWRRPTAVARRAVGPVVATVPLGRGREAGAGARRIHPEHLEGPLPRLGRRRRHLRGSRRGLRQSGLGPHRPAQPSLAAGSGRPRSPPDRLEGHLAADPAIVVPTIALDAELDPYTPTRGPAAYWDRFIGKLGHRALAGTGHNIPQEASVAFARAVIDAHRL
jgi:pimeloyl-ACP methyl ester carboxylesterase